MVKMRVTRDTKGRTSVYIPSFIRDQYGIQNGDVMDVDTNGKEIIMTPLKLKVGLN
jgi:AbrB family looped-hinge helix DNA binding protein